MKLIKKLFGLVLFGGIAYGVYKMAQRDEVQETLFELLGEDTYLEAQDKLRRTASVSSDHRKDD